MAILWCTPRTASIERWRSAPVWANTWNTSGSHRNRKPASYYALELRANIASRLRECFPRIQILVGDRQERHEFLDGFFDRILAIHVLEHLPNLPAALREMHRLCDKQKGVFTVVIPCEGSLAYGLGRRISA